MEEEDEEEAEEELETVVLKAPEEKWDCETIISEFLLSPSLSVLLRLSYAMLRYGKLC